MREDAHCSRDNGQRRDRTTSNLPQWLRNAECVAHKIFRQKKEAEREMAKTLIYRVDKAEKKARKAKRNKKL